MSNRISLFHVLDEVRSSDFPVVLRNCVCVSSWNADEEGTDKGSEFHITVILQTPGADPEEKFKDHVTVRARRHRLFTRFENIPLTTPTPII